MASANIQDFLSVFERENLTIDAISHGEAVSDETRHEFLHLIEDLITALLNQEIKEMRMEGYGLLHESLIQSDIWKIWYVFCEDDHLPKLIYPLQSLTNIGL